MQLYARLRNVYMYITLMNKNIVDMHGLTYLRLLPYRLRGSVPAAVLSPIPLCPIQSRPSSPNALCNPSLVDVVHRVSGRPRVAPRNWATAAGRWDANHEPWGPCRYGPWPCRYGFTRAMSISPRTNVTPPSYLPEPCNGPNGPKGPYSKNITK